MSRYANTPLQELLAKFHACAEAREWAGSRTLAAAWAECPRSDWMLWLLEMLGYADRRVLRLFACWCVRQEPCWSLLADERSRSAVEMAERYARGEATGDELAAACDAACDACDAACDAAWSAARSAARAAAWSAAWAATWSAACDTAWYTAWYAAWSAASAAAWSAACSTQTDRLREVVPVAVVERLVDCYAAAEEAVKHAD
jgi:hypothetical protein